MKSAARRVKARKVIPIGLICFSGCVYVTIQCFSIFVVNRAKYDLLSEKFFLLMLGL